MIAANNSHVLAFDNLSGMPGWLSDALCRLATGGSLAVRQPTPTTRKSVPGRATNVAERYRGRGWPDRSRRPGDIPDHGADRRERTPARSHPASTPSWPSTRSGTAPHQTFYLSPIDSSVTRSQRMPRLAAQPARARRPARAGADIAGAAGIDIAFYREGEREAGSSTCAQPPTHGSKRQEKITTPPPTSPPTAPMVLTSMPTRQLRWSLRSSRQEEPVSRLNFGSPSRILAKSGNHG